MTLAKTGLYAALRPLGLYRLDGTTLVDAELSAYGAGFAFVEQALEELSRECFIQTAEGYGLSLREEAMQLLLRPDGGEEKRRTLLLYRLAVAPTDYNVRGMVSSLRAAGLNALIVEDFVSKRLRIVENGFIGSYQEIDSIKDDVRRMLPAHLEADFDMGSMTWNQFDAADPTFDVFDGHDITWAQWDIDGGTYYPQR